MRIFFVFALLLALILPESVFGLELRQVMLEVPEQFRKGPLKDKRELKALPGVKVSVFASGMIGARFMAENSDGVLFLSVPSDGTVLALPDRDRDGAADEVIVFARGLKRPHGLAFRDGELLVAEAGSVAALRDDGLPVPEDTRDTTVIAV